MSQTQQTSPWFVGIYPFDSIRFRAKDDSQSFIHLRVKQHLKMSVELQHTYHFHFTPKKKPNLATLASGNVVEDEFPNYSVVPKLFESQLEVTFTAYINTLELPSRHLPLGDMTSRLPRRIDEKTPNRAARNQ